MSAGAPDGGEHHTHGVAGVVLAGGHSRRMGRDKAFVVVDGRPMVVAVAEALRGAGCRPVTVVGGDATRLAALGFATVPDRWPGEGPLGAIVAALAHTGRPTVVSACDLPWLDAATVQRLIDAALGSASVDVAMATTDRDEPLCACWMPSAAGRLATAFAGGERAVHVAIGVLHVRRVAVDAPVLRNVNTQGDLPSP